MAKRLFDKEVVNYIFDEMDRRGYALVDEVAEIIKPLGLYDPVHGEEQWCKDKARRMLASRKSKSGTRTVYAVDKGDGKFIDLRTAKKVDDLDGVIRQLTSKRDGIDFSIKEALRHKAEIEGQTSMFSAAR